MKYIAVAALLLTQIAWAQSAPPPPPSTQSIGKPHVCTQDYPIDAVMSGEQGTSTIGFKITTEGTTKDIHLIQSSGSQLLDEAAMSCAASWLYKPAIKDGQPVEVPWKAEVRWVLRLPPPDPAAEDVFRACAATYKGGTPPAPEATTEVLVRVLRGVPVDARLRHSSGDAGRDTHALACAKKEWGGAPGSGFQVLSVAWNELAKPAK